MCGKTIGAQKPVTMQTSTGISRYDDRWDKFVRLNMYQNFYRSTSRYNQPVERCLRSLQNDHDFDLRFPYIPNTSISLAVMINQDVDGSLGSQTLSTCASCPPSLPFLSSENIYPCICTQPLEYLQTIRTDTIAYSNIRRTPMASLL